ncbi:hypothetical protein, partial [Thiolapillus sp.]|uniref:hypothetical protein n=1 Tax=Thiolapillus sp. TaxID=2017437 RepID=UPI0025F2AA66
TTQQLRKLVAAPYLSSNDWTPRLNVYFASPLALCARRVSIAATGVYQPSLRSPWLAAEEPYYCTMWGDGFCQIGSAIT